MKVESFDYPFSFLSYHFIIIEFNYIASAQEAWGKAGAGNLPAALQAAQRGHAAPWVRIDGLLIILFYFQTLD